MACWLEHKIAAFGGALNVGEIQVAAEAVGLRVSIGLGEVEDRVVVKVGGGAVLQEENNEVRMGGKGLRCVLIDGVVCAPEPKGVAWLVEEDIALEVGKDGCVFWAEAGDAEAGWESVEVDCGGFRSRVWQANVVADGIPCPRQLENGNKEEEAAENVLGIERSDVAVTIPDDPEDCEQSDPHEAEMPLASIDEGQKETEDENGQQQEQLVSAIKHNAGEYIHNQSKKVGRGDGIAEDLRDIGKQDAEATSE
jgi:hypothetical protein